MVLTFTGSLSAAEAGRSEVRTMLIGALGCNFAWGIIDAFMYLMGRLSDEAALVRAARAVRDAPDAETAHRRILDALPPIVASALQPPELERIQRQLNQLDEKSIRPRLRKTDWLGAGAVFLWVFVCTFPVVIPFIFLNDAVVALRVSNAIAIGLLFLTGYLFGKNSGLRPWPTGLAMVLIGLVLVAMTITLGG
jgi:VIT1/CCC1 family predicted Fe2+/Mn2+ transporter